MRPYLPSVRENVIGNGNGIYSFGNKTRLIALANAHHFIPSHHFLSLPSVSIRVHNKVYKWAKAAPLMLHFCVHPLRVEVEGVLGWGGDDCFCLFLAASIFLAPDRWNICRILKRNWCFPHWKEFMLFVNTEPKVGIVEVEMRLNVYSAICG